MSVNKVSNLESENKNLILYSCTIILKDEEQKDAQQYVHQYKFHSFFEMTDKHLNEYIYTIHISHSELP